MSREQALTDYDGAVRGLADDVATLKATLLPVATGPDIAALVANIENRAALLQSLRGSLAAEEAPAKSLPRPEPTSGPEVPKTTVKKSTSSAKPKQES